jgi:ABC-2 type transport system ATP-binding protein
MSECVLRVSNVSKRYGKAYALRDVNVAVGRGQIYGLIGLNGAGKSTLMRCVLGLAHLDGGRIELFGKSDEAGLRRSRRKIGQTIESPAPYPNMTAAQNLEIQSIIGGVPCKSSVGEMLETVGLSGVGRKKAKDFSLGMKQRLSLAMALITNPELLILDEPINGLDPKGIVWMRDTMRRLVAKQGMTLFVSSHILDELSLVATHYGIIHKGQIVGELSADELSKRLRRYIGIVVDDVPAAVAIVTSRFGVTDYEVCEGNALHVYERLDDASAMNAELVKAGLAVGGLFVREQRLEEYFMKLTEVK